uniref:Uncharacterized protein n=1 Tax=Nelumbo nucifera TaxID=4432 RepID=A0A822YUV6_NELNU|nr:TPA_asm: hypothetical protein HUJ06_006001 [Nelumbo nucifera]
MGLMAQMVSDGASCEKGLTQLAVEDNPGSVFENYKEWTVRRALGSCLDLKSSWIKWPIDVNSGLDADMEEHGEALDVDWGILNQSNSIYSLIRERDGSGKNLALRAFLVWVLLLALVSGLVLCEGGSNQLCIEGADSQVATKLSLTLDWFVRNIQMPANRNQGIQGPAEASSPSNNKISMINHDIAAPQLWITGRNQLRAAQLTRLPQMRGLGRDRCMQPYPCAHTGRLHSDILERAQAVIVLQSMHKSLPMHLLSL